MEEELKNNKDIKIRKFSFPSVSVLGILISILLVTVIGTVLWQFIQNKKISQGLQGVYITDISDRSAVVSWVTSQPNKTELVYSNEEIKSLLNIFNSQTEYDRRDLEEIGEFEYKLNKRGNYYVHSVHLRNLVPQTEYYFAIRNGLFLNSAQYINTFSTIREREDVDTPEVGYGNIYNQDGNLISDTLVFFELTNREDTNKSQKVSYVMDGRTGWSVNISNLMDSEFKEEYVQEEETYLGIYVVNVNGEITKIINVDKIRPAENISAYSNEYKESDSDVKGIMAILCECKSCTPSCPSDYSSSCPAGWNCTTKMATCTSRDSCTGEFCETITGGTCYKQSTKQTCTCESCTPYCPKGYTFSCPAEWNCATMNSVCEKYDSCTGDRCGTQSGNPCYKPTTLKVDCTCETCTPKCPEDFHMGTCKEGYNCVTAYSSCTQKDSCTGQRCGPLSVKGQLCYKETTQKIPDPVVETPESCAKKYEDYKPGQKQIYYWCDCKNEYSACVGALELYNNPAYGSSCPKYCQAKKEEGWAKYSQCEGKNLRERNGNLVTCEYGCQENGNISDDSCKPKSSEIPQEVNCTEFKVKTSCILDPSCTWDIKKRSCSSIPVAVVTSCSSIKSQAQCNSTENCEFVNYKCQEINLENYISVNTSADYCTGLKDSNNKIIPIGYGPGSINTHQGFSKCSIDISAMEVNLGNQVPGSTYNENTGKREWKEGYKCEVGEYQAQGYGYNVIITQPDGTQIKYAHLKYPSCENIVTGDSGTSYIVDGVTKTAYHLHVEVMCSNTDDCETCQGKTNPCRAIAGGCFACSDTVTVNPISGGGVGTEGIIKSKSLFSLISKVRAAEMEYIDPAILIKDLELPEGTYEVKSASTSITTDFVKTDDTHIVFFEDANDNGKLDSDERLLSPYETQVEYQVSYEMVADSFKLSLQEGLNLVSFPILFKDENEKEIKKVSELIEYLNKQGTEITTITAYRGGKFLPYVIRDGVGFGDDFNILPGEGYFVLSHASGNFLYSGTKVKDGLEVQLYQGWNLVNIYNSEVESYSGFDILKKMREQSVGADILSKWEDGMYINIVSEESGEYGTDFNVYQSRGYFVRVSGESGSFTPN